MPYLKTYPLVPRVKEGLVLHIAGLELAGFSDPLAHRDSLASRLAAAVSKLLL